LRENLGVARPLGQRTRMILGALREQPATARDLAAIVGEPVPAVQTALRNLGRAQRIVVVGVEQRERRQPVAVYACADLREPAIIWLADAPAWLR
jgi:predicted transcriptional regulator